MCQFTKKNKEIILIKIKSKKYRRQQKNLEHGIIFFFFVEKSSSFEKVSLIEQTE